MSGWMHATSAHHGQRSKGDREGATVELIRKDHPCYGVGGPNSNIVNSSVYGPFWLAVETRSNWECVDRTLLQATVSPARTQTWSFGMKDPLAPMYLGVGMTGRDVPLFRIRVPR